MLRFYAELGDFLPGEKRGRTFLQRLPAGATVKHVIESAGVPHTEVELVLRNGVSVGFDERPRPGDRLSVYPVFESLDVAPLVRVREEPLRKTRFVLDVHLGKLALILRLLGFDALFPGDCDDGELARISAETGRILLTRDIGLLKRSAVTHGCYIRSDDPAQQAGEVLDRLDLRDRVEPFRRCARCGGELQAVDKEEIIHRLEPLTRRYYDEFRICPDCGRIYWKGSHYPALRRLLEELGVDEVDAD
jgi:hypothetical protein